MIEFLLVVITAIGTLLMSVILRKKEDTPEGFVVPKEVTEMFDTIDEEAEEAQEEIEEALDGPTPEDDLAKLGNRRRR